MTVPSCFSLFVGLRFFIDCRSVVRSRKQKHPVCIPSYAVEGSFFSLLLLVVVVVCVSYLFFSTYYTTLRTFDVLDVDVVDRLDVMMSCVTLLLSPWRSLLF